MTPPGACASRSSPDLSFRESVYDALDQVTQTRQFDFKLSGNVPRTEAEMVALRGNRAVGDGVTRGQAHTYDAAGRLTSTIDALSNIERYEYNALGDRTRWIDKNGAGWTLRVRPQGAENQGDLAADAVQARRRGAEHPGAESRARDSLRLRRLRQPDPEDRGGELPERRADHELPLSTRWGGFEHLFHGYYDAGTGNGGERIPAPTASDGKPPPPTTRWATRCAPAFAPGVNALQHTYRTYDRQGQVVHEVNALNNVTRYTYTSFGEPETVTRYSVTISGTPANGMYWTRRRGRSAAQLGLDENGNLMPDAYARTITMAYDKLGRKISVTQPTATYLLHAHAGRRQPGQLLPTQRQHYGGRRARCRGHELRVQRLRRS